jgi:hypothetical protein
MVPVTIYALFDNYTSNNEYLGIASTYIYRTLLHEYGWDEVVGTQYYDNRKRRRTFAYTMDTCEGGVSLLFLVCFQLYL